MFFTYAFERKPARWVYEIWHTPLAFGHGIEISVAQADAARKLMEERGQNMPNSGYVAYWLKLRNLKDRQMDDFAKALDDGKTFAIYGRDLADRERAIVRIFSDSHGRVGSGARILGLPAEHIPI